MPKRKQITAILLCIAAVVPMFLSSFFLGGRIIIRHMMLEKMEHDELQTIRIHRAEFRWYTKGHEIVMAGRMFDVRSLRIEGDTCLVTGLYDDDETELFDHLVNTEDSKRDASGQVSGLFQACLGITAIGHPSAMPEFRIPVKTASPFWPVTDSRLLERLSPVLSPPPDC